MKSPLRKRLPRELKSEFGKYLVIFLLLIISIGFVSGFLVADPRIIKNPEAIEAITYKELRELSYMGASVLHEDAIFPVRKEGIPINIRNTNKPDDQGTWIVESTCRKPKHTITGIAGKKGFASINIEKDMMNSEIGFGRKVL